MTNATADDLLTLLAGASRAAHKAGLPRERTEALRDGIDAAGRLFADGAEEPDGDALDALLTDLNGEIRAAHFADATDPEAKRLCVDALSAARDAVERLRDELAAGRGAGPAAPGP